MRMERLSALYGMQPQTSLGGVSREKAKQKARQRLIREYKSENETQIPRGQTAKVFAEFERRSDGMGFDKALYGDILGEMVVSKNMKVSKEEARKIGRALTEFTTSGFDDIKAYSLGHRFKSETMNNHYKEMTGMLEKLIRKSPKYRGTTYRGMTLNENELNNYIKSYNAKKSISMNSLSSWTRSNKEAESFLFANTRGDRSKTQPTIFISARQRKGTSISQYAPDESQREVLVSKRARWNIKDYKTESRIIDGKKRKVHVFYLDSL